jgi:hypothetical protein
MSPLLLLANIVCTAGLLFVLNGLLTDVDSKFKNTIRVILICAPRLLGIHIVMGGLFGLYALLFFVLVGLARKFSSTFVFLGLIALGLVALVFILTVWTAAQMEIIVQKRHLDESLMRALRLVTLNPFPFLLSNFIFLVAVAFLLSLAFLLSWRLLTPLRAAFVFHPDLIFVLSRRPLTTVFVFLFSLFLLPSFFGLNAALYHRSSASLSRDQGQEHDPELAGKSTREL